MGHYVEIFLVRFRDKFAFIRWMEYKFHTNLYMLCSVHQWSRMHTNIILEPLRPPKRWDGGHQKFQNNGALFHMKDNPSSRGIILLLYYSMLYNNSNVTLIFFGKRFHPLRPYLIHHVFFTFSDSPFRLSNNFRLYLQIYYT